MSPAARTLVGVAALLALGGCGIPRWPADGTLTSPYGVRWSGLLPTVHRGVDVAMPTGTPVHAMVGGRVRFAGEMSGYGTVVWLEHRQGILTAYAHLADVRVVSGQEVEPREIVGTSGASGSATAPHLHFEVWVAGRPVDPVRFLGRRPRRVNADR